VTAHFLIRQYYDCFNERRLADAADLFASDAVIERPPFGTVKNGGQGWVQFAELWLSAFPDAKLRIDHVEQRGDTICEVDVDLSGTHSGDLSVPGHGTIKPAGRPVSLRLGELLEIRGSKITYASLSFDTLELLRQVSGKV